jgi:CheY-like chemotaxis protein
MASSRQFDSLYSYTPGEEPLTATFAPKYSLAKSGGRRILATEMESADGDEVNEGANSVGRDRRCRREPWGNLMNEWPEVPIIAVVDDDESVRESLADLAESVGYEAALFASAEEFLESIHHRDSLTCVILDVRLPGISGVELHKQLTRSLRSIPTIFITAHADREMSDWATKPGVIAVLCKPFQPEVLLQAVQKAILQSRA